jgi:nitroreductase
METIKTIAKRHSVRKYKAEQLPEAALHQILEAGGMAPVGMRAYKDLHMTVIRNADMLKQLAEQTQAYMKSDKDKLLSLLAGRLNNDIPPLKSLFYNTPVLVLISSKPQLSEGIDYVNAGCIMENMALAAADAGIGSVILWGPAFAAEDNKELKTALNIPTDYKVITAIAFGYSDMGDLPEKKPGLTIGVNYI